MMLFSSEHKNLVEEKWLPPTFHGQTYPTQNKRTPDRKLVRSKNKQNMTRDRPL